MIFDLDGTLVQTEQLKATSYARAVLDVCPSGSSSDGSSDAGSSDGSSEVTLDDVRAAYADLVGRSREEVATALVDRFDLEPQLEPYMNEFGVETTWEALVEIRMDYYEDMIEDADLVWEHRQPQALELLAWARETLEKVGLATTSKRWATRAVLRGLRLEETFDAVVTASDVAETKPDPEAYERVLDQLGVEPEEALAVEDSPAGVQGAQAAGVRCLAVPTALTASEFENAADAPLEEDWIVRDPERLLAIAQEKVEASRAAAA